MMRLPSAAMALSLAMIVGLTFSANAALLAQLRQLSIESPSEAVQALQTLDTNHDGAVGFDEVAAFARTKNMDYAATLSEFSAYDVDRNGMLNADELAGVLGLAQEQVPAAAKSVPLLQKTVPQAASTLTAAQLPQAGSAITASLAKVSRVAPAVQRIEQVAVSAEMANVTSGSLTKIARANSQTSLAASESSAQHLAESRAATLALVANNIALEASEEKAAAALDQKTADLRANLTALRLRATQAAREMSVKAAERKAEEIARSITSLEDQALRLEVKAAGLRRKSGGELATVNDLSSVANEGISVSQRAR